MIIKGTVLIERKDANQAFYGSAVPAAHILSGRVPAPEIASPLYEVIEAAEGIDESSVPQEAYVPSMQGGQLPVNETTTAPVSVAAGYAVGSGAGGAGAAAAPRGNETLFDAGKEH